MPVFDTTRCIFDNCVFTRTKNQQQRLVDQRVQNKTQILCIFSLQWLVIVREVLRIERLIILIAQQWFRQPLSETQKNITELFRTLIVLAGFKSNLQQIGLPLTHEKNLRHLCLCDTTTERRVCTGHHQFSIFFCFWFYRSASWVLLCRTCYL